MTSATSANGATYTTGYSWANLGDISSITNADSYTTSISYDTSSRLKSISEPVSSYTFAYTLNGAGSITAATITDPNGSKQKVSFDGNHYVTSDIRAKALPEQQTTTYSRNTSTDELITASTDQLGRETCYGYDSVANITSVTRLCGTSNAATWSYSYETPFNQLAQVTDPLNHSTTLGFDSYGNATSVQDATGVLITATYNGQGQETSATDPLNNTIHFSYNSFGDVSSIQDALNQTFSMTNDSAGRTTTITDPLGGNTNLGYDAVGHLTSSTDANGNTTSWLYSKAGATLGSIDPNGYRITYSYSYSAPQATIGNITYNFDGVSNVTSMVDGRGLTTSYTYDGLNRLTQVKYNSTGVSGFNQTTASYTYDGGNRLLTEQDSGPGNAPGITRTYDGLDDLLTDYYHSPTFNVTVTYTYDSAQRRTTMTAANQAQTTYGYDNANRITSISRGSNTVSIGHDADGRTSAIALPNGIAETLNYDANSRVTSLDYGSLGSLTYQYDSNSRVVDVGGTLASVIIPPPVTATYQSNSLQLHTWNNISASYDANGNLASDPSNNGSYTWNEKNQLATANANGNALSFTYDGFGRRVGQTANGTFTGYVFDGLNVVQEQMSAGNADVLSTPQSINQAWIVANSPQLLANLGLALWKPSRHHMQALVGPGLNAYSARIVSGVTWTILQDILGSTMVAKGGSNTTTYAYSPFGKSTISGVSNSNPYQFAGSQLDASGLYYMNARYYSPLLQTFISVDPLGITTGKTNWYDYVYSSPTNLVDPVGLQCATITIAGGGDGSDVPKPPPVVKHVGGDSQTGSGGFPLVTGLGDFFSGSGTFSGGGSAPQSQIISQSSRFDAPVITQAVAAQETPNY